VAKERKQRAPSRGRKPKSADDGAPAAPEEPAAPGTTTSADAASADAKPDAAREPPEAVPAQAAADRPEQFSVPAELVEHILLGPIDDRRVLQDSPLLGDVWTAYALDPGNVQDILITPHRTATAASVASVIPKGLELRAAERQSETNPKPAPRDKEKPKIAYLQGLVGARMYFDEVLCILVPLTQWWRQPKVAGRIVSVGERKDRLERLLRRDARKQGVVQPSTEDFSSLERYVALAGLIYWISKLERPADCRRPPRPPDSRKLPPLPPLPPLNFEKAFARYQPFIEEIIDGIFAAYPVVLENARQLMELARVDKVDVVEADVEGYIFQISLNRIATPALDRSVAAVKADAANSLFKVSCKNIVWAVLDSGIDDKHAAFIDQGRSRVRKTFDFTKIREIVSNDETDIDPADLKELANAAGITEEDARDHLKSIAADARAKRPIDWGVVEKLITLKDPAPPSSPHGTHVAGIIGAQGAMIGHADGMCPDIRLYDFRVLGQTIEDTEFAIIAALQYIRYVNERHNYITIHGANLSLSIPHNVRNYACGRTPVCNECERLVESGAVVVAAAGNRGFQKFELMNGGVFEGYAAFSITDPGNGESVITVGSTHGNWPHTYGVSFFSSRGPTGDGRLKPDLVAPGERVQSCVTGGDHNEWGPESGTSMAAPHVSGAAAMLLARYEELIGQPRRVKRILCESATDLGRERSFQGHGMLDVLRAFQSI
jgi:serine protease AprX